jgi:hypothetical protein
MGLCAITRGIQVRDADNYGLASSSGGDDWLCEGCVVLGADEAGIIVNAPRARLIGNEIVATGVRGILMHSGGDNSIAVGNLIKDQGDDSIEIDTNCDNCVVIGNRTDGAVDDNSGTSLEENLNVETAF